MAHENGRAQGAPDQTREHLLEMIKKFDIGMLVTRDRDDRLHARPMALAEIGEDGELWFVTGMHTGKVEEIAADAKVAITMQSAMAYLSVSGEASLVRDHARVQKLWKEQWRVWFPDGPDEGDICLVKVRPTQGEYWDQQGLKGLRYLLSAAKAYVTGDRPKEGGPQEHGQAKL